MLTWLARFWRAGRRRQTPRAARRRHVLRVEPLEGRRLLALVGVSPASPIVTYDSNGHLQYTAATDSLDITATPLRFRETASSPLRLIQSPRNFEIHVKVAPNGSLIPSISSTDLVISGQIDIDGNGTIDASGTLLTGHATQFGFADAGNTDNYDYRFTPTGGALASYFNGRDIGINMTSEHSTFTGSFASDFSGGAKGNVGAIAPLPLPALGSLSGFVYVDVNNNGQKENTESPIASATVTLTGLDDLGQAVNQTATTNAAGFYQFLNLRPGQYQLHESQPAGFIDGKDTVGTLGGTTTNDTFSNIVVTNGENGADYNFGELGMTPQLLSKTSFVIMAPTPNQPAGKPAVPSSVAPASTQAHPPQPVSALLAALASSKRRRI